MNFISFNLDNGVEVKSHRRRSSSCCRLCRMWPVLYAGCALSTGSAAARSHQARKIKVSEFHVDAKYLKSVFGVCFVCFSRVRRPANFIQKAMDCVRASSTHGMTTDMPHIMVLRKGYNSTSGTREKIADVKVHLSFSFFYLQPSHQSWKYITSNIQHISAQ